MLGDQTAPGLPWVCASVLNTLPASQPTATSHVNPLLAEHLVAQVLLRETSQRLRGQREPLSFLTIRFALAITSDLVKEQKQQRRMPCSRGHMVSLKYTRVREQSTASRIRLEFPRETGLILKCPVMVGNPLQTKQGK